MLDFNYLKEKQPIVIKGHKNPDVDSLASCYLLKKLFTFKNIKSEIFIENNILDSLYDFKKYGFVYKTNLLKYDNLFLVDHLDIYDNEIVGCIDHHVSSLSLEHNYVYKKQTSCAKIIYEIMIKEGMELSKDDIYLIIYSQYMDSLSFNSTKALKTDKEWCQQQINKYGFDEEHLYNAGLCLSDLSIINEKTISYGRKDYKINDNKIKTSYVIVKKEENILEKEDAIINQLPQYLEDFDYWMFFAHCIEDNKTCVYFLSKDYIEINKYTGLISRGDGLIPIITKKITKENVTNKLIQKKITISTMESCTSGMIASTITDTEGASSILKGSSITYSNEYKIKEGVNKDIIDVYGVYSKETAIEMAKAAHLKYETNFAIGITGSIGRVDPNNNDSIVGEIFYAIFYKDNNKEFIVDSKIIILNNNLSRKSTKENIANIVLANLNSLI